MKLKKPLPLLSVLAGKSALPPNCFIQSLSSGRSPRVARPHPNLLPREKESSTNDHSRLENSQLNPPALFRFNKEPPVSHGTARCFSLSSGDLRRLGIAERNLPQAKVRSGPSARAGASHWAGVRASVSQTSVKDFFTFSGSIGRVYSGCECGARSCSSRKIVSRMLCALRRKFEFQKRSTLIPREIKNCSRSLSCRCWSG